MAATPLWSRPKLPTSRPACWDEACWSLKLPFWFYGFESQMGHKLPIVFFKQATVLTTFLFLKPAQGGLSQMSCFIEVFSVGLTKRSNMQLSWGGLFQRAGACWQGACTHARLHAWTTSTCAHSHPHGLPKRGKLWNRDSHCTSSGKPAFGEKNRNVGARLQSRY